MSTKAKAPQPPTFAAACAALRRDFGLALRRKPGRRPKDAEAAYLKLVRQRRLRPRQHVDALMGALMTAHPKASVLEICSWFDPGFLRRELGDHYGADASHIAATPQKRERNGGDRCDSDARVIIKISGLEAPASAPDPARTEGGSDR